MHSSNGHYVLLLLPFLAIAAFWAMARLERMRRGASARAPGFVQRNGKAVAAFLVVAVGL